MNSLTLGSSSTSGGSGLGTKLEKGLYGSTGTIVAARQEFDKELGDYKPDVFITIEIDKGSKYNDEIDIFGSFAREDLGNGRQGEITGWGGAFKVDATLNDLGAYDGLTEEQMQIQGNTIPPQCLQALQGMKVHYVTYCAGKNKNKDKALWNQYWVLKPAGDQSEAEEAWNDIISQLKGDDYAMGKLTKGRDYLDSSDGGGSNSPSSPPANMPGGGGSSLDDLPI